MKIVGYRDLDSKDGLLPLMEQAFGWPFNTREFERFVKVDPRMREGSVGFCSQENGQVVGYVGVLDLPTRTSDGAAERVGGIYGVATLPGHTRKGICSTLLAHAHQYFKERGYRFSLLNTSPTLVAHDLYRKLGYVDEISYPSAYKFIRKRRTRPPSNMGSLPFDVGRILKIYNEYVRNRTGFVVRDETLLKALMKFEGLTPRQSIVSKKGYVLFRKEKHLVRVRELVALDRREMGRLIEAVEEKARDLVFCRGILDSAMREVFRSHGFAVLEKSHGVMMAKPLTDDASFRKAYADRFYMSSLDHF